ncbi:sensor histidine kinase [Pseudonocardia adelaidensis]|uniref:histidine kinase n=1 Tax=Pseudonocardia adelaidensis TaxID=648754 RepID=A0ABP9P383_9PSEU
MISRTGRGAVRGRIAVAAAVLAVVVLAGTALVARLQSQAVFDARGVAAILVAAAAWSFHNAAPAVSAAAATATVVGYVLAGQPYGPILSFVVLACFALARHRRARITAPVCAAAGAALAAALGTRLDAVPHAVAVTVLLAWPGVFVAVPALAGALTRMRAEAVTRERAALLARGADEERLRVAREVHDIAGHGFAVVAMQAGVALTVFDEQPAQARVSLDAIRSASEHALQELQAVLDTLHAGVSTARDVPDLVERVRAGGLPVALRITGDPAVLGDRESAAVYRLVQEALTNVLRHAGPTAAEVDIEYGAREVSVAVRDRGTGGAAAPGRGLNGLRQRVEELRGTFTARERSTGGYEVAATFPHGGGR